MAIITSFTKQNRIQNNGHQRFGDDVQRKEWKMFA